MEFRWISAVKATCTNIEANHRRLDNHWERFATESRLYGRHVARAHRCINMLQEMRDLSKENNSGLETWNWRRSCRVSDEDANTSREACHSAQVRLKSYVQERRRIDSGQLVLRGSKQQARGVQRNTYAHAHVRPT